MSESLKWIVGVASIVVGSVIAAQLLWVGSSLTALPRIDERLAAIERRMVKVDDLETRMTRMEERTGMRSAGAGAGGR